MGIPQSKIDAKGNDNFENLTANILSTRSEFAKTDLQKFLNPENEHIQNSGYIYNLKTPITILFKEEEHEIEDQLVLFPHETTSKLDKFTEQYEQLKKEKKEMDKLLELQSAAVNKIKRRQTQTKQQVNTVMKKNVSEDIQNTKKIKQIHKNLDELSKKFSSLTAQYGPKGNLGIDELKELWKQDQVNAAEHIKTVANAASKQTPTEVKIEVKSTPAAGGAKKIEFKEDPLDYIFENKDLKEIAKLWNIQYSKNILPTLKIAFKYKNRSVLNNKEWKQLVSKLNIKFKTNDLNKPEIVELVKKKLINVPTI